MIGTTYPQRITLVLGDAQLARAAQRGDAASLGILLEHHQTPPLYALVVNILGYGQQAEDTVLSEDAVAVLPGMTVLRRYKSLLNRKFCKIHTRFRQTRVPQRVAFSKGRPPMREGRLREGSLL